MRSDAEKISFTIWNNRGGWFRITANDCRTEIRKLSDGACICDAEMLAEELNRLNKELAKRNAYPVYNVASWDDFN